MKNVRRFLKKWLKILELDKYRIRVTTSRLKHNKGSLKDDIAMIDISLGEKKLELSLNPENRKAWNESLIVHELTHVLLYRLWEFVDLLIRKGYRGKKAQRALRAQYESLEEESVDRFVNTFLKLQKKRRPQSSRQIRVLQGGLKKRRRCA